MSLQKIPSPSSKEGEGKFACKSGVGLV